MDGAATGLLPVPGVGTVRRLRATRRLVTVVLWTVLAGPVQAVCLALPGRPKVVVARVYWAVACRLLGLRVRVLGRPAGRPGGRAVVYASNHTSWLDIPVLGGVLEACFVAKAEVGRWPVVSTVAWLGRTVFVSRRARTTGRERDDMRARLARGDDLILFPEGTSSDGCRVLPFRSAFFSVAEGEAPPLVQPVTVVYDRLAGLPLGRASRPVFAWYGDMELGGHFWRLAQWRGMRATVVLHDPVDPARVPSRKALAHLAWERVAEASAALRQNRAAEPLPAGGGANPAG